MASLNRIIAKWDTFESVVGGFFITLSGVIITIEVILRTFIGTSIMGADELSCFAVIWSVFFTASIGLKKDSHVRIDVILHVLPQRIRRYSLFVSMLGVSFFSAYLCYSGIFLVHESLLVGDRTVGSLTTPLWIPQLIMPLGGFLLFARSLGRITKIIREMRTRQVTPETMGSEGTV